MTFKYTSKKGVCSTLTLATLAMCSLLVGCADEARDANNQCENIYDNNTGLLSACGYGVNIANNRMNTYNSIPSMVMVQNAERDLITRCQTIYYDQGLDTLQACQNGVHSFLDVVSRRYRSRYPTFVYPNGGYYRVDSDFAGGPVIVVPHSHPSILVYPHPVHYYDRSTWFGNRSFGGGSYSTGGGTSNGSSNRVSPSTGGGFWRSGATGSSSSTGSSWGTRRSASPVGSTWNSSGSSPSRSSWSSPSRSSSGSSWSSSGSSPSRSSWSSPSRSSWGSSSGSSRSYRRRRR